MQTQMFASYDPKVQLLDPVSMPWNHHTGKEYVREHLYQIIGRALHLWASSTVTDFSLAHETLRGAAFGAGNLTQAQSKTVWNTVGMMCSPPSSNVDVHHVLHVACRDGVMDSARVNRYVMQHLYCDVAHLLVPEPQSAGRGQSQLPVSRKRQRTDT